MRLEAGTVRSRRFLRAPADERARRFHRHAGIIRRDRDMRPVRDQPQRRVEVGDCRHARQQSTRQKGGELFSFRHARRGGPAVGISAQSPGAEAIPGLLAALHAG